MKRPHPNPLPKGEGISNEPPLPLAGEGRGEGRRSEHLARARALRRTSTPAERLLWRALRNRALAGAKARRQVPCGPWIVDFLFPATRLVIELDGYSHDNAISMEPTPGGIAGSRHMGFACCDSQTAKC